MAREGHATQRSRSARKVGAARTFATAEALQPRRQFGFMFPDLQRQNSPADFLPENPTTVAQLIALGETMAEAADTEAVDRLADARNSPIPAAYTYLGQFIDHDITKDEGSFDFAKATQNPNNILPDPAIVLFNIRTGELDLDSVYEPPKEGEPAPPRDPSNASKMKLSAVSPIPAGAGKRPAGKDDLNDLPRMGVDRDDAKKDRAAIIGDPRNDENTIVAQLHTAFLRAHNALVDRQMSFEQARRDLTLRYQSVVLDDFLPTVCQPTIVADVLSNGPRFFKVSRPNEFLMPLEFTVAAYRFGHSMIRSVYNFNVNFKIGNPSLPPATLDFLFAFTALSGQLAPAPDGGVPAGQGDPTLPENWIIQWERFLPLRADVQHEPARRIDTLLTSMVFALRDELGNPIPGDTPFATNITKNLAIRNLLRGYILHMPTGQAVARLMGAPVLSGRTLLNALPASQRAAATPFADRMPLWFYILAEAGSHLGTGGARLGPVGSRIVAETLWQCARHAKVSILDPAVTVTGWSRPHTLAQLIELSGGLSPASTPAAEF
jgi:hypothetical protein